MHEGTHNTTKISFIGLNTSKEKCHITEIYQAKESQSMRMEEILYYQLCGFIKHSINMNHAIVQFLLHAAMDRRTFNGYPSIPPRLVKQKIF